MMKDNALHVWVDYIDPFNAIPWKKNLLEHILYCSDNSYLSNELPLHPKLNDSEDKITAQERMVEKLKRCSVLYDFQDDGVSTIFDADHKQHFSKQKLIKKLELSEILEYMIHVKNIITADISIEMINMVEANLFRTLPSHDVPNEFDEEEGHYHLEPAWPHLLLVYEVFQQFLSLADLPINLIFKLIKESFVSKLMSLFNSSDSREREALKSLFLVIYNRLVFSRSLIKHEFSNIALKYIFLDQYTVGMPELLGIFEKIIMGYDIPMRPDNCDMFERLFMELHKCNMYPDYYKQLIKCVNQFLIIEPDYHELTIKKIVHYWPKTNSRKQILFLEELLSIILVIPFDQLEKIIILLMKQVFISITSSNIYVSNMACKILDLINIKDLNNNLIDSIINIVAPILIKVIYNQEIISDDIKQGIFWFNNKRNQLDELLNNGKSKIDKMNKKRKIRETFWSNLKSNESPSTSIIEKVPIVLVSQYISNKRTSIPVEVSSSFNIIPKIIQEYKISLGKTESDFDGSDDTHWHAVDNMTSLIPFELAEKDFKSGDQVANKIDKNLLNSNSKIREISIDKMYDYLRNDDPGLKNKVNN